MAGANALIEEHFSSEKDVKAEKKTGIFVGIIG